MLRRRSWHPTPVFLPGKSHGRRSLVGCTPWEQSDTTERLPFHSSLSRIGKANGNPLQCSCLENPRDGGAWWAAIYGITQSRTRLKWLSSSKCAEHYQIVYFKTITLMLCEFFTSVIFKSYLKKKIQRHLGQKYTRHKIVVFYAIVKTNQLS